MISIAGAILSRYAKTVGLVTVAALLVVACGDDGSDAQTSEATDKSTETESTDDRKVDQESGDSVESGAVPPNGDVVDVVALDNTFRVETIEVVAGTEVRWENRGRNDHNVLPSTEGEDWGADTEDFAPGDEYSFVFDTPGTYPYYCDIHGTTDVGMVGSVTVLPAEG